MATQKVSIRYLIDVAIGNPEPGIVNFNALYTVLQVISEKLDIQNTNIEIDSSFCPVSANMFEDKSNASSERLVEQQTYEYDIARCADQSAMPMMAGDFDPRRQVERKVSFDEKMEKMTQKDDERSPQYRSELKQHIDSLNARLGKIEDMFVMTADADQSVECLRRDVHELQEKLTNLEISVEDVKVIRAQQEQDLTACRKKLEHDRLAVNVEILDHEVRELKETLVRAGPNKQAILSPITNLETQNELRSDFNRIQGELMEVKSDICSIRDKLEVFNAYIAANTRTSPEVTEELFYAELGTMKTAMSNTDALLAGLEAETAAQKSSAAELAEKLEELKRMKIDKDEIDELLSEKADYTMLQRKVSVENMNADRRKLEKQLTEITECFVMNEERVQKQIGEIRKFLGDRSLEDLLFDFKVKIDKEIQVVRDGLKRLAEMKPDVEAAAARIKNLACLSCDQEVVMRAIELNNLSKFGDAYVTESISPEVALELHKLREAGKISVMEASEAICDFARNFRHTGGMHTIVTAKDRVTKIRRKH